MMRPEVDDQVTTTGLILPECHVVSEAEPGSEEWLAVRREGITGTDLPKILGLSSYGNALSVWLDKRGELDDDAGEAARWGNLLEETVAQEWARREGVTIADVGVVANDERPWLRASLDRVVLDCPAGDARGIGCGLEVKTRSAFVADQWRDGVPDAVLAQTTWGLMATGYPHMHVAALIGGQRLVSFRVDRDPKLEEYLLEAGAPVWAAVVDGVPPVAHPDAEGVLLELLDRLYSDRAGERELEADAESWLAQYAEGSALESRGKKLKAEAKAALVQQLDDGDTGTIDGAPVFTYKRPRPGHAMPSDEVRRLEADSPRRFRGLIRDGYVVPTDPGPRFTLKKRTTTTEENR